MPLKLGFNAKLYRSTSTRASWGTKDAEGKAAGAGPTLDEVPNVKGDITVPIEKVKADVTTRGNAGWRASKGTIKDVEIEIQMVYDPSDTDVAALTKAFLTDAVIPLAFLDGPVATAGTEGLWADFEVTKMEKGEPMEGEQMVTFGVTPGYSAVPPEWVKVTGA